MTYPVETPVLHPLADLTKTLGPEPDSHKELILIKEREREEKRQGHTAGSQIVSMSSLVPHIYIALCVSKLSF